MTNNKKQKKALKKISFANIKKSTSFFFDNLSVNVVTEF